MEPAPESDDRDDRIGCCCRCAGNAMLTLGTTRLSPAPLDEQRWLPPAGGEIEIRTEPPLVGDPAGRTRPCSPGSARRAEDHRVDDLAELSCPKPIIGGCGVAAPDLKWPAQEEAELRRGTRCTAGFGGSLRLAMSAQSAILECRCIAPVKRIWAKVTGSVSSGSAVVSLRDGSLGARACGCEASIPASIPPAPWGMG